MATRSEEFFHDKWLGMVQTDSDGLVVAKPVLLEAQCAARQAPDTQEKLRELCPAGPKDPDSPDEAPRHITDVVEFFIQLLDFDADLFDTASQIPDEVSLYAPEGPQTLRPTLGLLRQDDPEPQEGAGSPASNAAAPYVALLWDVTMLDSDEGEEAEHNPGAIGLPPRQARDHHRRLVLPRRRQVRSPAPALPRTRRDPDQPRGHPPGLRPSRRVLRPHHLPHR